MHNLRNSVFAAVAALSFSSSAFAVLYDAGADLAAFENSPAGTGNPVAAVNGAWRYGTSNVVGGTLTQFAGTEHNDAISLTSPGALQGWQEDTTNDLVPAVAVNPTNANYTSGCCGVYEPNEFWLHGGPGGSGREVAIVRWIAPSAGTATYSANFINESGAAGAASYVLINGSAGSPGFSGNAAGTDSAGGTVTPAVTPFAVNAGDTIDFEINAYKSTGLIASVTFNAVPEPTTLSLLGLSGLGLLGRRRRHA